MNKEGLAEQINYIQILKNMSMTQKQEGIPT